MYENIMIPITDGKRMYNISCNLKETYESESKAIIKAFQKVVILHTIDDSWKEHLRELDELRHSVQNASYENKDPLLIYKLESYNLFKTMVDSMNRKTAAILMRGQIPVREQDPESAKQHVEVKEAQPEIRQNMNNYQTKKDDISNGAITQTKTSSKQEPIRVEKHAGRNDLCPCGSGKKYKHCHGV